VENSQVGVFAAYASRHGYALVDKRLFIPEQWFSNAYAERRHKCTVPDEVAFHTKPQLAAEMVRAIRSEGRLPFKYLWRIVSMAIVRTSWTPLMPVSE
jgi:SRSO17 transposase